MRKKVRRRSSKRPEMTVTWYIQMAASRIQPIGKRPYRKPSTLDETAMVTGMWYATTATTRASAHEARPAQCAFQRSAPRVMSMQAIGMRATRAEAHWWPSGLVLGVNASSSTTRTPRSMFWDDE